MYTGCWWGNLGERDHLEDPSIDGRIILLMDLKEVGRGNMNWIELAQERDRCRVLMNTVMRKADNLSTILCRWS